MKHILFLLGVYPGIGGVEVVTTVLVNELIFRGYLVTICSFEEKNIEIRNLSSLVNRLRLTHPVYTRTNRKRLHSYIVNQNVDIIVNQWCMPFYVSALCKAAMHGTNCKLVSVHHNLPNLNNHILAIRNCIQERKGSLLLNKFKLMIVTLASRMSLRYMYEVSDRYIVLSPSYIPIAKKFMFISDKAFKMKAISNPLTIEGNINQNKQKVILYVGRIEFTQKKNNRLVGIWSEIEKKYPDWKLEVIGDGPDKLELSKLIEEANLNNIYLEGFQNPLDYYSKSSMLLLTSDSEGFGLVISEAMKFGVVPIVYGSYDAVYDIIEDGIDGYITPKPYRQSDMVKYIEKLIQDKQLREQMSRQAILKSNKFKVTEIVDKWETLFNSLSEIPKN